LVIRPDLPAPLRGALWMLTAGICYVIAATIARRYLGDTYSAYQLTFIRSVVAVAFIAPMLARSGRRGFHVRRFRLCLLAAALTYFSIMCWFFAATRMPVADFFTLQFTTPLFTMTLAMVVLRQKVGPRNWAATLVGFAGVLVVLRPGIAEVTAGALVTLMSSAGYATVNTVIKVLSRTEAPTAIVFYANLLILPLSLPLALAHWRTPDGADAALILAVTLFMTVAFVSTARAIQAADARIVQPVSFLRLIVAAAIGFIVFGETPDLWTWVGAAINFASTYYVIMREGRRGGH